MFVYRKSRYERTMTIEEACFQESIQVQEVDVPVSHEEEWELLSEGLSGKILTVY